MCINEHIIIFVHLIIVLIVREKYFFISLQDASYCNLYVESVCVSQYKLMMIFPSAIIDNYSFSISNAVK